VLKSGKNTEKARLQDHIDVFFDVFCERIQRRADRVPVAGMVARRWKRWHEEKGFAPSSPNWSRSQNPIYL